MARHPGEERPEIRIGDRERREVDDRLRSAQDEGMLTLTEYDERAQACYAARFRHELEVLTADLPDQEPPAAAVAPTPPERPVAPAADRDDEDDEGPRTPAERMKSWWGNLVAVAAAGVLAVTVLGADQGAAVFGSTTVAAVPGQTQVGALFGSVRVVVPEGTQATTSGFRIFGSTDCAQACVPQPPGAPQVEVTGAGPFGFSGMFGSVEVVTPAEAAQGDLFDDGDDD